VGELTVASENLAVVKVLLDAAGVTVSEEELERFAASYATVRAQADGLYRPDLRFESPAVSFDPEAEYA
jgi:hypothetical protein